MNNRSQTLTSFRGTLVWVMALAASLLLLTLGFVGFVVFHENEAVTQRLTSQVVRGLVAEVSDQLTLRVQGLNQLAAVLEQGSRDHPRQSFLDVAGRQGLFEDVFWLDSNQRVQFHWPEGPWVPDSDPTDPGPWLPSAPSPEVSWNGGFVSPRTGRLTVAMARTFSRGILVANVDLGVFSQAIAALGVRSGMTISVVDSQGTDLADSDVRRLGDREADSLPKGSPPSAEGTSPQMVVVPGSWGWIQIWRQTLPSCPWAVVVRGPVVGSEAALVPVLFAFIVLVGLVAMGAVWIVHWFDRSLVSSLRLFRGQLGALARGELGPVEVRSRFRDLHEIFEALEETRQAIWAREQELRMGELRFRRMFDEAAVGISHASYSGELLDLNHAMATMLGYANTTEAKAALGGSTVGFYVRPEERLAVLRMLQSSPDAKVTVTTEFFHRTGKVLTVRHHLSRVLDVRSGEFYLEGFSEDITELKRAEQAVVDLNRDLEAKVAERTRHLEKALEDLEVAQGHVVRSEKMAALGQLIAGIAHELNTPLGAIHASNDSIASLLKSVLSRLPPFLSQLPDGLEDVFVRLVQASHRGIDVIPSTSLRISRQEMKAALAQDQVLADETLVEALVELGLRPPLTPWLPLLQSPLGQEGIKIADQIVSLEKSSLIIASASEKAARIIHALRTFSYQGPDEVFQPVVIREGVDSTLTLFQSRLKSGVTVKTTIDPSAQVWGLSDKLNQVWANLLANALDSMGDQGVLEILVESLGGMVRVSFIDSGPGVSESIQGKIFEPFFTTKKLGEGTGMGLDICKKIVEGHRGTLGFESRPGRTVFYVELPEAR